MTTLGHLSENINGQKLNKQGLASKIHQQGFFYQPSSETRENVRIKSSQNNAFPKPTGQNKQDTSFNKPFAERNTENHKETIMLEESTKAATENTQIFERNNTGSCDSRAIAINDDQKCRVTSWTNEESSQFQLSENETSLELNESCRKLSIGGIDHPSSVHKEVIDCSNPNTNKHNDLAWQVEQISNKIQRNICIKQASDEKMEKKATIKDIIGLTKETNNGTQKIQSIREENEAKLSILSTCRPKDLNPSQITQTETTTKRCLDNHNENMVNRHENIKTNKLNVAKHSETMSNNTTRNSVDIRKSNHKNKSSEQNNASNKTETTTGHDQNENTVSLEKLHSKTANEQQSVLNQHYSSHNFQHHRLLEKKQHSFSTGNLQFESTRFLHNSPINLVSRSFSCNDIAGLFFFDSSYGSSIEPINLFQSVESIDFHEREANHNNKPFSDSISYSSADSLDFCEGNSEESLSLSPRRSDQSSNESLSFFQRKHFSSNDEFSVSEESISFQTDDDDDVAEADVEINNNFNSDDLNEKEKIKRVFSKELKRRKAIRRAVKKKPSFYSKVNTSEKKTSQSEGSFERNKLFSSKKESFEKKQLFYTGDITNRRSFYSKKPGRRSFYLKDISVDQNVDNSLYFSNIYNRRNGLITSNNNDIAAKKEEEGNDSDEFVHDLLEFKRLRQRNKKGHRPFVHSVENLVKQTKKRKQYLTHIFNSRFSHDTKMDDLRETCLLDDGSDEEVTSINSMYGKSHEQPSAKKPSSVIEFYYDKQGDVIRKIEIVRVPGQSLGFFIRFGNGVDRKDGIFVSRVVLDSIVDQENLLHAGDEILEINKVDVTGYQLEQVAKIMQTADRLILKTRSALPLPMIVCPLLKSSHSVNNFRDRTYGMNAIYEKHQSMSHENKKQFSDTMLKSFHSMDALREKDNQHNLSDSSFVPLNNRTDTEGAREKVMQRTWSDPNQLNDVCEVHVRERSKTLREEDSQRRLSLDSYQNYSNKMSKSPCFARKLPPILDGKIQDFPSEDLSAKGFSRAQRYQAMQQKSPTHELENTSTRLSAHVKYPRVFNKKEAKKSNISSIPSTESLSSTSDSEDSIKSNHQTTERLQVYPSDSITNNNIQSKAFTGRLSVALCSLIGRLSSLDGQFYCTIEVNDEFKATTQLHKIKEIVNIEESFDIDVQDAHRLRFFIFHCQTKKHHKLVTQACIVLEHLLQRQNSAKLLLGTTNHIQIRVRVSFTEAENYLQRCPSSRSKGVFGFKLSQTLVKEENTIPIIVRKCVEEIEKRGLSLTGIYRISGNARKKKLLRQQFEENSGITDVSNPEIDCHVLAGILKDYLRELPNPLISVEMYHNICNKSMVKNKDQNSLLVDLMKKLPYTNRATLIYIMDHLKKVAANNEKNKMNFQNLAVCFGPVMMATPSGSNNISDMTDFKKQIDALEFLLSVWPSNFESINHV